MATTPAKPAPAKPAQSPLSVLERILTEFTDAQLEAAGLLPRKDQPPAMIFGNLVLGSGLTSVIPITVGGSQPFVAQSLLIFSTGAFALNVRPSTYANGKLSEGLAHSYALCGPPTAPKPYRLGRPWLFDRNAVVNVDVTDLSAGANTIYVGFAGYRSE